MDEYVTLQETRDYLNSDEYDNVTDDTINTLIGAGREMIDAFCGRSFPAAPATTVPYLVKVCNMELVQAMLADSTKNAENTEGYSYSANTSAFSHILARLTYLKVDDEVLADRGKMIHARLI